MPRDSLCSWQKLGNDWEWLGWKLLLTVVTYSFVLNVTGYLDPTLKCTDLDQRNKVFHLPLRHQNDVWCFYC